MRSSDFYTLLYHYVKLYFFMFIVYFKNVLQNKFSYFISFIEYYFNIIISSLKLENKRVLQGFRILLLYKY